MPPDGQYIQFSSFELTPWNFFLNSLLLRMVLTKLTEGWRRLIGCLKLQVTFRKRATNCRAVLREMTLKDKASHNSKPPCTERSTSEQRYLSMAAHFSLSPSYTHTLSLALSLSRSRSRARSLTPCLSLSRSLSLSLALLSLSVNGDIYRWQLMAPAVLSALVYQHQLPTEVCVCLFPWLCPCL